MRDRALPSPEGMLAQAFAAQAGGWVETAGGTPQMVRAVAHAAGALSRATSRGDVCLPLADIESHADWPEDLATARTLLVTSAVVGTAQATGSRPLILDDDGRLYLHRYFAHERALARRIAALRAGPPRFAADEVVLQAAIARFFAPSASLPDGAPDWQRVAVAMTILNRFTVISGGPGTGKTTTVVQLIACLLACAPTMRIALAAPTGKAAARMTEAIRGRAAGLDPALRERLPAQASTVHRLLGMRGPGAKPRHHADNPLPCDLLIVDEASMLDLALAARLFDAVPTSARVVLLGDKDQLASVESGAVFADLCAGNALTPGFRARIGVLAGLSPEHLALPEAPPGAPLVDAAVWFTRSLRFADDSGIGRLAAAIRQGETDALVRDLRAGADPALQWLDGDSVEADAVLVQHAVHAYAPYRDALQADPTDHAAVTEAFGRFRLLCAIREGTRGVEALNAAVTGAMRARPPGAAGALTSPWFIGRPVMVLRNDYLLGLFNGDVGIALPDASGELAVRFPMPGGGFRAVPIARMPVHETAFATTVHKSQGSEFDAVLLVLPVQPNRVLTREMVYTAVTRARSRVAIAGTEEVLRAAVETRTVRRSGLSARLAESLPVEASGVPGSATSE
jgi:exodeoxyribonuclease V alpha subunit